MDVPSGYLRTAITWLSGAPYTVLYFQLIVW